MVFSSMLFLWIFLPLVLAAYYISPGKIRNGILVFFSLLFYAWGEPLYVFLMLFSVAVNFTGGILIEKYQTRKKKILVATLIINLGLLGYFKYFGTLTEAITGLFSADGTGTTLFQVALPIGISFYTFQTLGYVIDVYRGEVEAERNIFTYAAFISFFPQLVAGPIERTSNLLPQIKGEHTFHREDAVYGLKLMAWGFFKKLVIADNLAVYVDLVFDTPQDYPGFAMLLAAFFFTIQIYCDFSGYSDIAIGTAKLFDIRLMQNFNSPYFAASVKEFWSRWHISLSTWFRDYVYIPLGGNRKHQILNVAIVFLLTGIWHGAAFTYIVWGIWHGIFNIGEKICKTVKTRRMKILYRSREI